MEHFLSAADGKVKEALEILASHWRDDPEVRTPRLSEVVSLLERASAKLRIEYKATTESPVQPKEV